MELDDLLASLCLAGGGAAQRWPATLQRTLQEPVDVRGQHGAKTGRDRGDDLAEFGDLPALIVEQPLYSGAEIVLSQQLLGGRQPFGDPVSLDQPLNLGEPALVGVAPASAHQEQLAEATARW